MGVFKSRPRKNAPDQLIIHETAGQNNYNINNPRGSGPGKTLYDAGYGSHFFINWNSRQVIKAADPRTEVVGHCEGMNTRSVGFDHINPVDVPSGKIILKPPPKILKNAIHMKGRRSQDYVLPTLNMCEAGFALMSELINRPDLNIPNEIPGLDEDGKLWVTTAPNYKELMKLPGVFCHAQVSPARWDGAFMLIYFALRRAGGDFALPQTAYDTAQKIDSLAAGSGPGYVLLPESAQVEDVPLARRRLLLVSSATRRDFQQATERAGRTDLEIEGEQRLDLAIAQGRFVVDTVPNAGVLYNFETGRWNDEV